MARESKRAKAWRKWDKAHPWENRNDENEDYREAFNAGWDAHIASQNSKPGFDPVAQHIHHIRNH